MQCMFIALHTVNESYCISIELSKQVVNTRYTDIISDTVLTY